MILDAASQRTMMGPNRKPSRLGKYELVIVVKCGISDWIALSTASAERQALAAAANANASAAARLAAANAELQQCTTLLACKSKVHAELRRLLQFTCNWTPMLSPPTFSCGGKASHIELLHNMHGKKSREAFDNYHKEINAGHCVHVSYIDGNARVLSGRAWVIMTFDSVKDALVYVQGNAGTTGGLVGLLPMLAWTADRGSDIPIGAALDAYRFADGVPVGLVVHEIYSVTHGMTSIDTKYCRQCSAPGWVNSFLKRGPGTAKMWEAIGSKTLEELRGVHGITDEFRAKAEQYVGECSDAAAVVAKAKKRKMQHQ